MDGNIANSAIKVANLAFLLMMLSLINDFLNHVLPNFILNYPLKYANRKIKF